MKPKYLVSLTTSVGIAFSAIALNVRPSHASDTTFYCQEDDGILTTIAENEDGEQAPIFRWSQESLDSLFISTEPQKLCDSVSQKLDNYVATAEDPSALSFKGSAENDLPAVCIADAESLCRKQLFTLRPLRGQDALVTAQTALSTVLDPQLQPKTPKPGDRGVQRTSYQVNFWEFLGFGGF